MHFVKDPPQETLECAARLLEPYVPEISGGRLLQLLSNVEAEEAERPQIRYMTVKNYAARYDVSESTVFRMIKAGQLSTVHLGKRCTRIRDEVSEQNSQQKPI